jgi:hypothetical protein
VLKALLAQRGEIATEEELLREIEGTVVDANRGPSQSTSSEPSPLPAQGLSDANEPRSPEDGGQREFWEKAAIVGKVGGAIAALVGALVALIQLL